MLITRSSFTSFVTTTPMTSRGESSSPTRRNDNTENVHTQPRKRNTSSTSNSDRSSASANVSIVPLPKNNDIQMHKINHLKRPRPQSFKPTTTKGDASDKSYNEEALRKQTRQNININTSINSSIHIGDSKVDWKQGSNTENTAECRTSQDGFTKEIIEGFSNHDVLCGRQKMCYHHEGNRTFRHLISLSLEPLSKATTRTEKSDIAHSIVECITAKGGRFLKQDPHTNDWCVLLENMVREKVNHALRDGMAHQWKSKQSSVKETLRLIDQVQDHDPVLSDDRVLTRIENERHHVTEALKRKSSSDSNFSDSILDDYNEIPLSSLCYSSDSSGNNAIRGNDTTSQKESHVDIRERICESSNHDQHKKQQRLLPVHRYFDSKV